MFQVKLTTLQKIAIWVVLFVVPNGSFCYAKKDYIGIALYSYEAQQKDTEKILCQVAEKFFSIQNNI